MDAAVTGVIEVLRICAEDIEKAKRPYPPLKDTVTFHDINKLLSDYNYCARFLSCVDFGFECTHGGVF